MRSRARCLRQRQGGTNPPAKPNPPLGLSAVATSSSTIDVTFTSTAGDNSYTVERATGTAAFAQVGTVTAPATAGVVKFTDTGLTRETQYRYRVKAVKGTQESDYTSEAATTTLGFGNAPKEINGDITTNTTFYADTLYTLKGFIHVTNGATLTIQPGNEDRGRLRHARLVALRPARREDPGRRHCRCADRLHLVASGRPAPPGRLGRTDHRR